MKCFRDRNFVGDINFYTIINKINECIITIDMCWSSTRKLLKFVLVIGFWMKNEFFILFFNDEIT